MRKWTAESERRIRRGNPVPCRPRRHLASGSRGGEAAWRHLSTRRAWNRPPRHGRRSGDIHDPPPRSSYWRPNGACPEAQPKDGRHWPSASPTTALRHVPVGRHVDPEAQPKGRHPRCDAPGTIHCTLLRPTAPLPRHPERSEGSVACPPAQRRDSRYSPSDRDSGHP
jgi:hypothetical protein